MLRWLRLVLRTERRIVGTVARSYYIGKDTRPTMFRRAVLHLSFDLPGPMERSIACPSCSRKLYPDDAFCSHCGTRIQPRTPATATFRRAVAVRTIATRDRMGCASCNSSILPGELFCSACGARSGEVEVTSQGDPRGIVRRKLEAATGGKYRFLREIGRGGMGIVFLAREVDLDRLVAVKVLSGNWFTDDVMVERFRREARTIASLRHPSIVNVYGVGRAESLHYFTMDYIDGVSLSRVLRSHGPLSVAAAYAVLYQVGSGLGYAHRPPRDVVHRDVKPGNILLDGDGNTILTDFGIAKAAERDAGLTRTGLIIGTPEYMSPEQCRGDGVTAASDQYALGAVMYAALTGFPPFTGPVYEVLRAHTVEPIAPLLAARPDCPKALAEAITRMLAKTPADRWPDIEQGLRAAGASPPGQDDPGRQELANLAKGLADESSSAGSERASGGHAAEPPGRTPAWLRIRAPEDRLETGEKFSLRAVVGFIDGAQEEDGAVAWESTDPSIAEVDPATGQLVATGAGSAVITAWTAGIAQSVEIAVSPPRVVQLKVTPGALDLGTTATAQLRSDPRGRRGQSLDRPVLWSSSDPRIVTVSDDGRVQAHAPGTAQILAHCEGVGAAASVTVSLAPAVAQTEVRHGPVSPDAFGGPRVPEALRQKQPHPEPSGRDPAHTPAETATGERGARSRTSAWILAAVLAAGGVGGTYVVFRSRPDTGPQIASVSIVSAADGRPVDGPLRLIVDDTAALGVIASATDGTAAPFDTVSWSSTDPSTTLVDAAGMVRARAEGSALIRASVGGVMAEISVLVARRVAAVPEDPGPTAADQAGSTPPATPQRTPTRSAEAAPATTLAAPPPPPPPPPPAGPPPQGTLALIVLPWADIYIDGKLARKEWRGTFEQKLSAGPHTLRLVNPNSVTFDTSFVVRPGVPVQIRKEMQVRKQ